MPELAQGMISIPVPSWVRKSWTWRRTMSDPHITLGYMPAVTPADAESIAWLVHGAIAGVDPFDVDLRGQDIFGDNKRVALVVPSREIRALRHRILATVLRTYPRIVNTWTHRWRPHVTVCYEGTVPPFATDCTFQAESVHVRMKDGLVYELPLVRSARAARS